MNISNYMNRFFLFRFGHYMCGSGASEVQCILIYKVDN